MVAGKSAGVVGPAARVISAVKIGFTKFANRRQDMNLAMIGKVLGEIKPVITVMYRGKTRRMKVERFGISDKANVPYVVGRDLDLKDNPYRTFSDDGIEQVISVEQGG
jgi:hypothetical protein